MLVDGDNSHVNCVCSVDSQLAQFQIDSGSTYTQILPALAPRHVPRHGLGAAQSLGRLLWFPTCEVHLAPLDCHGNVMGLGVAGSQPTRVQVGSLNLLGLRELRQWRVQLTFSPEASCSADPGLAEATLSMHEGPSLPSSVVPLDEALSAASALNEGVVTAEDATSDTHPWLVDIRKVSEAVRKANGLAWWPMSALPPPSPMALAPLRKCQRPPTPKPSLRSTSGPGILFGTADALVSETIPPLLLPMP